jgi:hypothetical protein
MLDVTKPTDQEILSQIPTWIRETRAAVNAVADVNSIGTTELEVLAGSTSLTVGNEIGSYGYETILITAAAAISLTKILGGSQGQVKVFVFDDSLITIEDGIASSGNFYLNQLPVLSTFSAQAGDVLVMINIGGDGGATSHGYWKEISRQIALK